MIQSTTESLRRGRPTGALRRLLLDALEDRECSMRDLAQQTGYTIREVNRVLQRLIDCREVECMGLQRQPWAKRPVAMFSRRRPPADAHALLRLAIMGWK